MLMLVYFHCLSKFYFQEVWKNYCFRPPTKQWNTEKTPHIRPRDSVSAASKANVNVKGTEF